jgi:thiol-disulfide isomerase/thioredoxin
MTSRLDALKARYARSRALRFLADVLLITVLLAAVGAFQTRHHPRGAMPALELRTLDGQPASLAAYRGKPLLLVLWAPWCGVCKVETDNVSRVRAWLGDRAHVVSIAAAYRELSEVQRYMREQAVDYPVLLAGDADRERLQVGAFPAVFVVDAEGRIGNSVTGYTTTLGLFLRVLWAGM